MSTSARDIAGLSPAERRNLLAGLLRKKAAAAESTYPLSFNQQGIWFLYQLAPESTVYNVTFSARIRSALDSGALRSAFQALTDRHPSLRTTFPVQSAMPVQQVHDQLPVHFVETCADGWSDDRLTTALADDAWRPFDLERGPLLRVNLFTRAARDHVLLMTVHHIVIDFWSLAIILNDLSELYPACLAGVPVTLPRPASYYSDYVRWQAAMLAGPAGKKLWDYWRRQLTGPLPALNLPIDRPRAAVQTYRGAAREFNLDDELSGRLKPLARVHGVTLYTVLLAAFDVTIACLTGQEDFLVASPVVGRNRAGFEGVVGLFTNPVMLRTNLSGNPAFRDLIGRVRETVLGALEHQDYPTLLLVQRLQPPRDLSRPPLAQVMFVLDKPHRITAPETPPSARDTPAFAQGETGLRMNPGGLDLESFPLDRRAASLDLVMLIIETSTALSVSLRYNSDLFDPSTIVRIGGHFESVLRNVVADNDLKLNGLKAILAEADRQQLIGLREERRNANLQMLKNIKRRPAAPAGRAPGHADHD